jgi:hypothetical protein
MEMRKIYNRGNGALCFSIPVKIHREMGIEADSYALVERIEDKIVLTPVSAGRQTNTETGADHTNPEVCAHD